MKTVLDSSTLVKRYVEEHGSPFVDELLQATNDLGLSVLCLPEVSSALNRRLREGRLEQDDYEAIKIQLLADISDATILNLTPTVIAHSINLLESNVLRAMDALHVACAIEWEADLFVSSDHRQLLAAKNHGLTTRQI